jgi:hypothetical protein
MTSKKGKQKKGNRELFPWETGKQGNSDLAGPRETGKQGNRLFRYVRETGKQQFPSEFRTLPVSTFGLLIIIV